MPKSTKNDAATRAAADAVRRRNLHRADTLAQVGRRFERPRPGRGDPVMPAGSARCGRIPSPIGELLVVGHPGVLTGLFVAAHERCPAVRSEWVEDDRCFDEVRRQLQEYFAGTRTEFDLTLDLAGTSFQRRVWRELSTIPFGQTTSYRELAGRIGHPAAARAVGAANGRNPISIIVPCHRVIGGDGNLTGYGWGTKRKAWLLDHERGFAVHR